MERLGTWMPTTLKERDPVESLAAIQQLDSWHSPRTCHDDLEDLEGTAITLRATCTPTRAREPR